MIESVEGINYNGSNLVTAVAPNSGDTAGSTLEYVIVNEVRGRSSVNIETDEVVVPGARTYETQAMLEPRTIEADLTIKGRSFTDLRLKLEKLTSILHVEEDVPIWFEDEPDRVYYGKYESHSENLEKSKIAQITITILCRDAYKYGYEKAFQIEESVQEDEDGGQDALVMLEDMSVMDGWDEAPAIDNAVVTGSIVASPDGFKVGKHGVYGGGWHGPSVIKQLDREVEDFQLEIGIKNENTAVEKGVGTINIYLFDADGGRIAKLGFGDSTLATSVNQAAIEGGGGMPEFLRYVPDGWDDFEGNINLTRGDVGYGDQLRITWTEVKNGVEKDSRSINYHYSIVTEQAMKPLAYIQVAFLEYKDYDTFPQWITDMKVIGDLSEITNVGISPFNEGSAETFPIYDLEVTEESTLIEVANNHNQDDEGNAREVVIGVDEDLDLGDTEEPLDRRKLVMHDTMRSTSSWQGATNVDSGKVEGTFGIADEGFYVEDWGSTDGDRQKALMDIATDIKDRRKKIDQDVKKKKNELKKLQKKVEPSDSDITKIKNLKIEIKDLGVDRRKLPAEERRRRNEIADSTREWIGPSLMKKFDEPLKSFTIDVDINVINVIDTPGAVIGSRGVGIVEVYLRDINDNMVCKMQMGDISKTRAENQAGFVTSGKRYNAQHNRKTGWNKFEGMIRIERDSGYFHPYVAQIIDGKHTGRRWLGPNRRVIPEPGTAGQNDVASIQIAIRKWVGSSRIPVRIKEIKVYSYRGAYEYEDDDAPTVEKFKVGDKVVIDVAKGLVLLNGEPRNDLFSLDTDLPALLPGYNDLHFSDNVKGKVRYRERFL